MKTPQTSFLAGRHVRLLPCLMMLFLAGCATPHREPTKEQPAESFQSADASYGDSVGLVSLNRLARKHRFIMSRKAASEKRVMSRGTSRVEIDPTSRVSYFNGELVVLSKRPQLSDNDVMVPRELDARFAALVDKPAVKKSVAKKTPVKPLPRKILGGKHFVIDAGHGGIDSGASRAGIREKDIALNVAKEVAALLRRAGARVTMTRTTDVKIPLDQRAQISNSKRPDAFISIHVNAADNTRARGIEVFRAGSAGRYARPRKLAQSSQLAHAIMRSLAPVSPGRDRGVKKSPGFRVLKLNHYPAVLVELGFLSNSAERQLLAKRNYQSRLAKAVVDGISRFATSI